MSDHEMQGSGFDPDASGHERQGRDAAPKRRKTVTVTSAIGRDIVIRSHRPAMHEHAPMLPTGEGMTLKNGANPGVDKEWFDAWREENNGLAPLVAGAIIWANEADSEDSSVEEDATDQEGHDEFSDQKQHD